MFFNSKIIIKNNPLTTIVFNSSLNFTTIVKSNNCQFFQQIDPRKILKEVIKMYGPTAVYIYLNWKCYCECVCFSLWFLLRTFKIPCNQPVSSLISISLTVGWINCTSAERKNILSIPIFNIFLIIKWKYEMQGKETVSLKVYIKIELPFKKKTLQE